MKHTVEIIALLTWAFCASALGEGNKMGVKSLDSRNTRFMGKTVVCSIVKSLSLNQINDEISANLSLQTLDLRLPPRVGTPVPRVYHNENDEAKINITEQLNNAEDHQLSEKIHSLDQNVTLEEVTTSKEQPKEISEYSSVPRSKSVTFGFPGNDSFRVSGENSPLANQSPFFSSRGNSFAPRSQSDSNLSEQDKPNGKQDKTNEVKANLVDIILGNIPNWEQIQPLINSPIILSFFRHARDQKEDATHSKDQSISDVEIDLRSIRQLNALPELTNLVFLSPESARNILTCNKFGVSPIVIEQLRELTIDMHADESKNTSKKTDKKTEMAKKRAILNAFWTLMLKDILKKGPMSGNESVEDVCLRGYTALGMFIASKLTALWESGESLPAFAVCSNSAFMNCICRGIDRKMGSPKLFDYLCGFTVSIDLLEREVKIISEGSLLDMVREQIVPMGFPRIQRALHLFSPASMRDVLSRMPVNIGEQTVNTLVRLVETPQTFQEIARNWPLSDIRDLQVLLENAVRLIRIPPIRKFRLGNSRIK